MNGTKFYCVEKSHDKIVRLFWTDAKSRIKKEFYRDFDKCEWPKMTIDVYMSEYDARKQTDRMFTVKWTERGGVVFK